MIICHARLGSAHKFQTLPEQAAGFIRIRNRRNSAVNRRNDPLGAGHYLFGYCRFLDPASPADRPAFAAGARHAAGFLQHHTAVESLLEHVAAVRRAWGDKYRAVNSAGCAGGRGSPAAARSAAAREAPSGPGSPLPAIRVKSDPESDMAEAEMEEAGAELADAGSDADASDLEEDGAAADEDDGEGILPSHRRRPASPSSPPAGHWATDPLHEPSGGCSDSGRSPAAGLAGAPAGFLWPAATAAASCGLPPFDAAAAAAAASEPLATFAASAAPFPHGAFACTAACPAGGAPALALPAPTGWFDCLSAGPGLGLDDGGSVWCDPV